MLQAGLGGLNHRIGAMLLPDFGEVFPCSALGFWLESHSFCFLLLIGERGSVVVVRSGFRVPLSTVRREQPQAQGLTPHILRVPKIINRGRRRSFAASEVASVVPTTRPTTSCARVPLPRRLQCRD
jgi:hypothetical protein